MESSDFNSIANRPVVCRNEDIILHIHAYLNQGNLYRIYQLLDNIRNTDEKRLVEELFVKKFGFSYSRFI